MDTGIYVIYEEEVYVTGSSFLRKDHRYGVLISYIELLDVNTRKPKEWAITKKVTVCTIEDHPEVFI